MPGVGFALPRFFDILCWPGPTPSSLMGWSVFLYLVEYFFFCLRCGSKEIQRVLNWTELDKGCRSCERPVDHIQKCCQQISNLIDSNVIRLTLLSYDCGQHCCLFKSTVAWFTALLHDQKCCYITNSTVGRLTALSHDQKQNCMINSSVWVFIHWHHCHIIEIAVVCQTALFLIDRHVEWFSTALPRDLQPCHMNDVAVAWFSTALDWAHDWHCCQLIDSAVVWLTFLLQDR